MGKSASSGGVSPGWSSVQNTASNSPTLDEGKLHSAILNAMNEYAAIRQEVCPDVLGVWMR